MPPDIFLLSMPKGKSLSKESNFIINVDPSIILVKVAIFYPWEKLYLETHHLQMEKNKSF